MGVLSFLYLLMIYLFQGMTEHVPASILFWLPVITTGLFWPWVFILLRDCRRRFNVK
jgi:rod shape-determining protein MreD